MKVAMLFVSLLTLATGVEAVPSLKCIDTMTPNKCNADTCSDSKKKWKCVKTCGLSDTCEVPVPSPVPSPVPTPGPSCEDLADVVKKGKKKCKLAKKCNKLGTNSTPKLVKKCKQGCAKDACKKYKKKTGTCKKKGKNVCPKTCCNLSIGGDVDCQEVCDLAYKVCEAACNPFTCFLCDIAKAACLALC